MNRVVYKVVTKKHGTFNSAMVEALDEKYSLIYRIGVKTTPMIGRIFVFKDHSSALEFKRNNHRTTNVLKGIATDIGFPRIVSENFMYEDSLLLFWGRKKAKKKIKWLDSKRVPPGTLSCSSFTPTDIVG